VQVVGLIYKQSRYDYDFRCAANDFVRHPQFGIRGHAVSRYKQVFGAKLQHNSEIIWPDKSIFAPQQGQSTLLIVGGGPSAVKINWQNEDYDQLWSMNHFFLNPILRDRLVNLWTCGNEVDIVNPKLLFYLQKFPESTALFETEKRKVPILKQFSGRATWAHTRYKSQIGTAARLLVIAALASWPKIKYVGVDGVPKPGGEHAFQPGKIPQGSAAKPEAKKWFKRQYDVLFKYIPQVAKSKLIDLGEELGPIPR
jgi:hypothetical protein